MRSTFLVALLVLATIGELVLAKHSSNLHEWTQYKKRHGKVYESPEEDARRFSLFLAAKEQIRQHNANEQASYKMGLSHLSDWTQEEFAQLNGLRQSAEYEKRDNRASNDNDDNDPEPPIPTELDWRKEAPNRVGPVKDQGKCGSDWAFATTGVLEGLPGLYDPSAEMVPLSEQQLMDCSDDNAGCDGGTISAALDDVGRLQGIESEQDYPYTGNVSQSCQFNEDKAVVYVSGPLQVDQQPDSLLKKYSFLYGPIAIGVHVNDNFKHYKSGIFNDATCGHLQDPDHAALLVGYGNDPKEGDYWIVKNSWSSSWGEEGYIRIKRGLCGIGEMWVIPFISDRP